MAKHVLIIDDDRNTVKYLSALLCDNGYEVSSAADGSEGLDKIRQSHPDLIVLDVMMPKRTGFVLFKQLKKDERFRDTPVLMLTGVSGILEELENHMEEGFEKPYDSLREALKKQVREMREDGPVRPEMFVNKPVAPDFFVDRVTELIGS